MASSKIYTAQIKQLTDLTNLDKLYWMQLNPTTYYFQSNIGGSVHTTTIQKLSVGALNRYILQIQDNLSKEIKVDATTDPTATSDNLAVLFFSVSKSVQRRSQNFFDKFLDNLTDDN